MIDFGSVARMRMTNEDFGIRLFLEQGPSRMIPREFFKNCVEAFENHDENGTRKVWIRSRYVAGYLGRKLSFINTGVGADTDTLIKITDLTGSEKKLGTENSMNRGQGGKIAGCKYNPLGLLYISRKNGVVSRAAVGYCATSEQWGRAEKEIDGVTYEAWEEPLTADEQEYYNYRGLTGDFFEVIMLGRTSEQDTFANPYGIPGKHGDDSVLNELLARIYRMPSVAWRSTQTQVFYAPDVEGTRTLALYGDTVEFPEQSLEYNNVRRERVALSGTYPGVEVEFVHCISHKARKAFPPRCAIVFEDEQYDVRMRDRWQNSSLYFGAVGLAGKLSILIHIPNGTLKGDLYRQNLLDKETDQPVTADAFASLIYAARPKWVLDLQSAVKTTSPKDIKESVEDYLNTLFARRATEKEVSQMTADKKRNGGKSGKSNPDSDRETKEETKATEEVSVVPDRNKGNLRPKLVVPEIEFLPVDNKISDLRGRTVKYAPSAGPGGTLYVNSASPMVDMFVEMVLREEGGNRENVRSYVRSEVMGHIALRVSQVVVYQRFIKGTDSWKEGDVADSLSVSALNAVVASLDFDFREHVGPRLRSCRPYQRLRDGGAAEDEAVFTLVVDEEVGVDEAA